MLDGGRLDLSQGETMDVRGTLRLSEGGVIRSVPFRSNDADELRIHTGAVLDLQTLRSALTSPIDLGTGASCSAGIASCSSKTR